MIINDKIRDKKLQNNINREAAKILVSSSDINTIQVKKYCLLIKEEQAQLKMSILL